MWTFFILIAAFIVFVVVMLAKGQGRGTRTAAANLATSLGFEVLEGKDAVRRLVPGTEAQAAYENYEKLPGPMRKFLESSMTTFGIAGTVDGTPVVIFLETRGGGKSRTTYTVVRADYPKPLAFDLRIAHEGTFTRLGKALFGLSDVEVGDAEFDRAVRIKSADEANAKAALSNVEARAAILGMLAFSKGAFATNAYAQWECQGRRFDPSEIRSVIEALVPVTRALGGA